MLLIQSRWMGDVLLCTPAVRALREAYPAARLVFATEAPGADALQGNPHLDEVLVLGRGWKSALRLQRQVRRQAFDVVVDFRSTGSTARVTALSGAPMRIGWEGRGPRTLAYTHLLPRRGGPSYAGLKKLVLLEPLGVRWQDAEPTLVIGVGPAEVAWASRVWEEQDLAGRRVIALSPLSRTRHKQWGAERWAQVGDALVASGLTVVLASGPEEREQLEAVADRMRYPAVVASDARSVRDLAALYGRAALWVGNDGGLKHVAAASGVPTITVYRWKQSGHWGDTGARSSQWGLEAPPAQGCDLRCGRCAHLGCLAAVSVERVVHTVQEALLSKPLAAGA
jgi:ADP-heptose:LPS heptosyltransferase